MKLTGYMEKLLTKAMGMKKSDWIVVGLIGLLLLVISIPTGTGNDAATETADEATSYTENIDDSYGSSLKASLEEVLSCIDGAGKVTVMITFSDDGEYIVEKDVNISDGKTDEETVYVEAKDETYPYISTVRTPSVEGIVVAAEGGDIQSVRMEIYEAVMALFPVEAHRIKVVKMSSRED